MNLRKHQPDLVIYATSHIYKLSIISIPNSSSNVLSINGQSRMGQIVKCRHAHSELFNPIPAHKPKPTGPRFTNVRMATFFLGDICIILWNSCIKIISVTNSIRNRKNINSTCDR